MKDKIKSSFDKASKTYDSVSEIQVLSSVHLSKTLKDSVPYINTILDIGCGTGNTTVELKKIYSNAAYTLCDISANMINEAQQKMENASYIICDAEKFDFKDQYDLGVSNLALQWFESIDFFLDRILKNCKYFAFSTLLNGSFSEYKELLSQYNIPNLIAVYPSFEEMEQICNKHGEAICEAKRYNLSFNNPFALARYFKKLGAVINASKINIPNSLKIHKGAIPLNYEVFFTIIKRVTSNEEKM